MSDLKLDTSKKTYKKLLESYKEGMAPEVSVVVDGIDLVADKNAVIDSVVVELSMVNAGMCTFSIANAYDIKAQKYLWIGETVDNGKEITVKMGYGDKKKEVFCGTVETVEVKASKPEGGTIEVTSFDNSYPMRRARKTASWSEKTYKQVVEEVAGVYSLTVEAGDASDEYPLIVQKDQTDFDFVRELASELNYQVFVLGETLYFKDFSDSAMQTSLITLKGNEHIIHHSFRKTTANQVSKVVVNGYDYVNREEVRSEVTEVSQLNTSDDSGPSVVGATDSNNAIEEVYTTVQTVADATSRGGTVLNQSGGGFLNGQCTIMGLPEILPGRYITFENLCGDFDQSFCVAKVTHTYDDSGYTTEFGFGMEEETLQEQGKFFGVYLAEVTGVDDDHKLRVKMPSRKFEEIRVNMMTASVGSKAGHVFYPSVGDQVLLSYLEGDIDQPYIMGGIWDGTNETPIAADEDNYTRMIRTPGGNELLFYDEEGKEKIQLTSKSGHTLVLNDEDNNITLEDSDGSNKLVIDSESGEVSLTADKKMTLAVGGVSIEIDGSGGNITLKATNDLKLTSTNISIEAQGSLKLKGGAETGIESSGILTIKGSMTKIN